MHLRIRISLVGSAVVVALLAAACGSDPDGRGPGPAADAAATSSAGPATATASPGSAAVPGVSADDAVAIALEAVGDGQVVETDADEFEIVVQVWEVTVVTADGMRRQVSVDMTNGTVVSNEVDD